MSTYALTQVQRVQWRLMPDHDKRALTILSSLAGVPIGEAFQECMRRYNGDVLWYAQTFDMAEAVSYLRDHPKQMEP